MYNQRKEQLRAAAAKPRHVCYTCRQAGYGCYCESVRPFETDVHFVILIHPLEVKRRIATGRMAHLCLQNSSLIEGKEFSGNPRVDRIVNDERNHCVVLYPGRHSVNLSGLSEGERRKWIPDGKKLVIFVIDGTWNTAGRMIRSENLRGLPLVSFDPETRSRFRVRKQPAPECLSTIEAIHRVLDLLSGHPESRSHDHLLDVFDQMVEFQLLFSSQKPTLASRL